MNGSTLHRSGLTRENMGVLATYTHVNKKPTTKNQINQYYKSAKAHELDLLWGANSRDNSKIRSFAKSVGQKSPAAYLTIGFIAGVLSMCLILLIVSISSINPKISLPEGEIKSDVTVIGDDALGAMPQSTDTHQEKYIVKSGDTLNGIAYRFYGKYDPEKILKIQELNSISNPESLKIGQELLIPVVQER